MSFFCTEYFKYIIVSILTYRIKVIQTYIHACIYSPVTYLKGVLVNIYGKKKKRNRQA